MSYDWFRVWHGMPSDPKWRTIARVSGQSISEVIAVWMFVMENASTNATERGRTHSLCSEDVASALDMDQGGVDAILEAMQGRVLEGDKLRAWEKNQPKREDGSAARSKAWREKKKAERAHENECERKRTQANAEERPDTDTDTDIKTPHIPPSQGGKAEGADSRKRASRLPDDWRLPDTWRAEAARIASEHGCSLNLETEAAKFRDYWVAKSGAQAAKVNWLATWRNWVRTACERVGRGPPPKSDRLHTETDHSRYLEKL